MILFIFKEILLYQPEYGRIVVILAVLGHFEAKKCAKCLKFLPSPKFMSQMEPLCKNWILFNDFLRFPKNTAVLTGFWPDLCYFGGFRALWGQKVCKMPQISSQPQIHVLNGATQKKLDLI